MLAHSLTFAPARTYQRLLRLALGAMLLPLLLAILPPIAQREQATPTMQDSLGSPGVGRSGHDSAADTARSPSSPHCHTRGG